MKNHEFFTEQYTREIMYDHMTGFGVKHFTAKELVEGVVQDILAAHFISIEDNVNIEMTYSETIRFAKGNRLKDIKLALDTAVKMKLITIENGVYKPLVDINSLQAAMDYCGMWFGDFKPPKGVSVIYCNPEVLHTAVNQFGGIDGLTKSMVMDLQTIHTNKNIH